MGVSVTTPYIEGIPFTDSISIESDFVTIEDVKDLIKSLYARPTFTFFLQRESHYFNGGMIAALCCICRVSSDTIQWYVSTQKSRP